MTMQKLNVPCLWGTKQYYTNSYQNKDTIESRLQMSLFRLAVGSVGGSEVFLQSVFFAVGTQGV